MMENFTLIELHLDDARFSNVTGGEAETDDLAEEMLDEMELDEKEEAEAERSGGSVVRRLVVLAIVAVAARAAINRMRSDDEDADYDVDVSETGDVETTA